jgi:CBS-domain-containing membrane protein
MREAIVMIAQRRGIAIVVDGTRRVDGVLTAGDLSRLIERGGDILPIVVKTVMTAKPKIARSGELASAVAYRMEQHGIMAMPVVDDDNGLVGVVHLHDLLRRGWSDAHTLIHCHRRSDRRRRRRTVPRSQSPPLPEDLCVADSADQVFFARSIAHEQRYPAAI